MITLGHYKLIGKINMSELPFFVLQDYHSSWRKIGLMHLLVLNIPRNMKKVAHVTHNVIRVEYFAICLGLYTRVFDLVTFIMCVKLFLTSLEHYF